MQQSFRKLQFTEYYPVRSIAPCRPTMSWPAQARPGSSAGSREELGKFIAAEHSKWGRIIKERKLTVD
ncbi:MAG: hypothetical protein ABWY08_03385 [Comamonas sp.]